jgi:hypothetical protein
MESSEQSLGETDLILFNTRLLQLEVVSCKTGRVDKPLEHMESLINRASEMGGSRAQATLAVFEFVDEKAGAEIRRHAAAHHVLIKTSQDFPCNTASSDHA